MAFEERMADKNILKSIADGIVQLEVLCIYTRRINYDSATVNIFFSQKKTNHIRLSSPWFLVVVFFFVVRKIECQAIVKVLPRKQKQCLT